MALPAADQIATAVERVLLSVWVGALWTVGFLVAPVLFAELDRQAAGSIAGILFHYLNYAGILVGGALLAASIWMPGGRRAAQILLVLMLVSILINEFGLAPQIAALREAGLPAGSDAAARFGRLHGAASALYLLNALFGLTLLIIGVRRTR